MGTCYLSDDRLHLCRPFAHEECLLGGHTEELPEERHVLDEDGT